MDFGNKTKYPETKPIVLNKIKGIYGKKYHLQERSIWRRKTRLKNNIVRLWAAWVSAVPFALIAKLTGGKQTRVELGYNVGSSPTYRINPKQKR